MSIENKELAAILLKSTAKYIAKRIDGKERKVTYRFAMKIMLKAIETAPDFEAARIAVEAACIVPTHNVKWFIRRKNPDHEVMTLARVHAKDIMDSINKRFVLGNQDGCPSVWKHYCLHEYVEDEGVS